MKMTVTKCLTSCGGFAPSSFT